MKYLLRAAKFLKGYRWQVIGAFLCLIITNAAMLVQPQFTRVIVDTGIGQRRIGLVIGLAAAMVAFAAMRAVFSFFQGVLMARTAQGIAYDVRNQLYAKFHALSFSPWAD